MERMIRALGGLLIALGYATILLLATSGELKPLDDRLHDLRFAAHPRAASGDVVFVDIDARSIESLGVWPWPRHIHATLLDKLMALGADDVIFDVDFSIPSSETEDATFAAALEEAGGYAHLAAFLQQQTAKAPAAFNLPLPRFRQFADPVAVNVSLDTDGVVRTYPYALDIGGETVRSTASLLAGVRAAAGGGFNIDYAIDPASIDRIPVADILEGKVDPARLAGKDVIVGASAVELRDFFVVPRFGAIPGALLQAVAAETLKQGRGLQPVGCLPALAVVSIIGIVALLWRRRIPVPVALATGLLVSGTAEAVSFWLYLQHALLLDTTAVHLATAGFVLCVFVAELARRGIERRRAEDRLRYLSMHDPLTGAFSRTRLEQHIEDAFARGEDVSVIVVDLRRFRAINDTLGHSQGDLLLRQVVTRLQSAAPDAVARLGGDSFALVAPAMEADKLEGYCQAVTQWLASPYQLADGHQAIIAATAGATTSVASGRDVHRLLSHADMALSAAKQRSGNGVALFTPSMDDRLKQRQAMDAALRQALARREFVLNYQPQVDLERGELVGAEALARWTHPGLGPVSPAQFVPAAEETGLIVELGRWALIAACTEAASWGGELGIAVNVSPVQFELSDIAADIAAALEASGLPPERLEIEITEGVFVRDFEAVTNKLRAIRRLGVEIALDDFGTGYSSLSYLGRLPIDKIKIDQSFVRRLPADGEAAAIVRAVVGLGASLGKRIIAEGIETPEQAAMLRALGCALGQGYYFGRPETAAKFAERLREPTRGLARSA